MSLRALVRPAVVLPAFLALATAAVALAGDGPAGAREGRWRTLEPEGRSPLEYALVRPEGLEPGVPVPVLLSLPPGPGTREMVETALELYFEDEALARGWVVVSPAAPAGRSFSAGGEEWIPPLLDAVAAQVAVEGRIHLVGTSNGGRGAFRVAGRWPERFASLTVLPGVPDDGDLARLPAVASLPVALHVGAEDGPWREGTLAVAERLGALGARDLVVDVREGEGHVLDSAVAVALFDRLDRLRAEEREREAARAAIARELDDLHDAAARADEERYFGHFAPEAVFVGTDATERWTLDAFRAYAREPFTRASAWTYVPLERHVEVAPGGELAWFYERLSNAKYGETRGSGVLVRRGGRWLVAHYVLSFAIPNGAAGAVVEAVSRAGE